MRYINKNQITEFIIEKVSDSKIKNAGKKMVCRNLLIK